METKKAQKWLWVLIVLILVGCIVQGAVATDGGSVRVDELGWVTDDGGLVHAKLYIPDGVNAQNTAPAVIASNGYNNTLGDMENNCIELARRGFIVLNADPYGHGNATYPVDSMTNDGNADGVADDVVNLDSEGDALVIDGGVYSALQYLGTLPYVDTENIGIIGHSMGGYSIQLAAYRALLNHDIDPSVTVAKAILVSCEGADASYEGYPLNIGTMTPEFDEFGGGHWNVTTSSLANTSVKMKEYFGFTEASPDLQYNNYYEKGNETPISRDEAIVVAEKGELRVPYLVDGVNHPDVNYSNQAIGDVLDFFNITLQEGAPGALGVNDQVWPAKNVFGLICLVCFFLLMLPVAMLLLQTKFFAPLVRQPYAGIQTAGKKGRYWLLFLLGIVPSALLFYPLMGNPIVDKFQGYISDILWPASNAFPMPVVNGLSLFMVLCGVIALVVFCVYITNAKKKEGLSTEALGYKIPFTDILKALLLGAITLFVSYMALALAEYFFNIDFRFLILNVMPMTSVRWGLFLTYVIFFIVYYVINSLVLNTTIAQAGQKEWVNYVLCVVFNIAGLLILRLIDAIGFVATGVKPLSMYSSLGGNSSLAFILTLSLMFMLGMAAVLSRFLYKKTGNIWVSGFVCALAATFFAVGNTAISSGIFN